MDDRKVRVINSDLSSHPTCSHGPTLLFERTVKGKVKRFFACSACRSRKDCDVYVVVGVDGHFKGPSKSFQPDDVDQVFQVDKISAVKKLPAEERHFCVSCSLLLLRSELDAHRRHKVVGNLTSKCLQTPTDLLEPLENNRKEAQFLFAKSTVKFLVETIGKLNLDKVVCVGTPRLHQLIQRKKHKLKLDSILLDIDGRLRQFYSSDAFVRFNLFNYYFFDGNSGLEAFKKFLLSSKDNLILIIDPPFGGLIEPIANTINEITQLWKSLNGISEEKRLPTVLFFPYFNEYAIKNSLPTFNMSDYIVNYENHDSFSSAGRKFGSPVRMFTNIPLCQIPLPPEEGYYFCEKCNFYVSKLNRHCNLCKSCTSKNGSRYVHCKLCGRCVKSSWTHCDGCNRCALPQHQCKRKTERVQSQVAKRRKK